MSFNLPKYRVNLICLNIRRKIVLIPHYFLSISSLTLNVPHLPSVQSPDPATTTLILIGALLLVLIILGGVLWVVRRHK
jgi:hypothetical protein